jgi:exodeoxyribonuclease V alpha subunit
MTEAGHPTDADVLLATLTRWCDAGWLRQLDLALARWLHRERPQADAAVLLAAALLAHSEGQGHSCLALDAEGIAEPGLDGPPAAQAELRTLLDRLGLDESGWAAVLLASGAVDGAAQAATGVAPLVLEGHRLYLRRHWREEQGVAAAVLGRVAALTAADEVLPEPAEVRDWLDRLFGPLDPADIAGAAGEPDWQRVACAVALRGRLALITGGPGTGKTYTVARLLALVWALHPAPQGLRIALAAPTGKAAARLKQSIDQALDQLEQALPTALDWAALRRSLGTAWTLHKLLGARPDTRRLRHDAQHPLEVDLLVVDEASMVHLELMAALLQALPARARLLLLGDRDQLASVEAGAVLGDLCSDAAAGGWGRDTADWVQACTGQALPAALCVPPGHPAAPLAQQMVMLRRSRRFAGTIGTLARAVNAGDAAAAWSVLPPAAALRRAVSDPAGMVGMAGAAGDHVASEASVARLADPRIEQLLALALHGREGAAGGYRQALALLRQRPAPGVGVEGAEQHAQWVRQVLRAFDRFRLLCALRQGDWGVAGLNVAVEAALRQAGVIPRELRLAQGPGPGWYEGRPVMVTRNDPALGVFNGDVGLALRAAPTPQAPDRPGPLRVWFADGDQLRHVLASRLAAVETAWAMTVHKSQGSEFEHTALVLPPQANPVLTRELVYTGITRSRQAFTLVAPQPAVFDAAVQRRTHRSSGLAERLVDENGR